MKNSAEKQLSRLLETCCHLSECDSLDGFLNETLRRLSRAFECDAGIFVVARPGDFGSCEWISWAGHGLAPDYRRRYPAYYRYDPFAKWLKIHRDAIPRVTTGEQLVRYDNFVRSKIYAEFFRAFRVHHILNVNLFQRQEVFGHVCMYRPPDEMRFGHRELRLASSLAPVLSVAASRALAEDRVDKYERGSEVLAEGWFHGAALVLDADCRILYADGDARSLIGGLSTDGDWRKAPLDPRFDELRRCCVQLGKDDGEVECELRIARSSRRIRCHVRRIERRKGTPIFVVDLECECSRSFDRMREQGLSRREQEVADAVALGLTNREVADTLCISVNTVQTHLKSIYEKLAVRNRTALVGQLAATAHRSSSLS